MRGIYFLAAEQVGLSQSGFTAKRCGMTSLKMLKLLKIDSDASGRSAVGGQARREGANPYVYVTYYVGAYIT